jgi:hypothetical protein
MFLNYLKNIFLNYILKNRWQEVIAHTETHSIRKVGVLVDETNFKNTDLLVNKLIAMVGDSICLSVICYKEKLITKESYLRPTFDLRVISWQGFIVDPIVTEFIETDFDILVSFYEIQKPLLGLITNNSKAKFKVGFASTDKRLHHLMIQTTMDNYSVFVQELQKYLQILHKIK